MVIRIDAFEKVTGRAVYADDIVIDGMLYAAPAYATIASALINSIDTSKAKQADGVVAVLTAKDVTGNNIVGALVQDHHVFADDRVRYFGDVLAVVVARTLGEARAAAKLVSADLCPFPALFSPAAALESGAPQMHPVKKDNVVSSFKVRRGDVSKGFKQSEFIVEEKFETSFIEHSYMEPECCIAVPEPDGSVTVHGGMQHPFSTRKLVARLTKLPFAKVRIVQTTLGGGFGGRDDTISAICARTALAALKLRRPVKSTYTREESIRESYKRHPFLMSYKAGIDADGKFRAMHVDMTAESGPYCSVSPFVIWRPTVQCTGPYIVPNVHCDTRAVYTNNTYTGAMRGFGSPQHVFACESFIDMCAESCGMDPVSFRRKNFFGQNSITHTGQRLSSHKVSISEVMDKALKEIGFSAKFKKCSRGKPSKDGLMHGVGFACSYRGVSLGAEGNDFCSAIVNIQPDASIVLEVGVSENGQGLNTAMTHILATELGVKESDITFIHTDTNSVPDGGPTVASRGTIVGGNAVLNAVKTIKSMMAPVIAKKIGAAKAGYVFAKGRIKNSSNGKTISFKDVVSMCHAEKLYLYALGTFQGPSVSWNEDTGQGNAYFTYVYACQACELTVDAKTGKVRVQRVVAAHDVGKAVNPQMAVGQIFGGVMMGLGFALSEEIKHVDGKIVNANFNTYKIPRSVDVPEIKAILVENPDKSGPWGAKSLGEPTNELMGAAVANAVYYATGVRCTKTPIGKVDLL